MLKNDIENLTAHERRVMEDAFHEGSSPRRTRGIILSALVILVGVVLFVAFGAGVIFLAGLTVVTVLVAASEKFTYQRTMAAYESLVRKLVNRMETLEGVPPTRTVDSKEIPSVNVSETPGESARPVHLNSKLEHPTP